MTATITTETPKTTDRERLNALFATYRKHVAEGHACYGDFDASIIYNPVTGERLGEVIAHEGGFISLAVDSPEPLRCESKLDAVADILRMSGDITGANITRELKDLANRINQ